MSLFGTLLDGLDSVFVRLSSTIKQNLSDYCDLETAEDDSTLVARDGSLMSIVRIDGVKSIVGAQNFYQSIVVPLEGDFAQPFQKKMHMMQFFFVQDPDRTKAEIRSFLQPAYETISRLNMDMNDMLDERVKNLADWTHFESCFVALWTRPQGLSKFETDNEKKKLQALRMKQNAPLDRAQDPFRGISILHDRHRSFVESTIGNFARAAISCEELDAHAAAREVRASIDPDWTSSEWSPALPGDAVNPQLRKGFLEAEEWDIVWPKLSWQLTPRDAKIVGDNLVEVGNKVYAPIYMELFPRDPQPFWDLFGTLMNRNLPWRASFLIEGDGMSSLNTKKAIASILGFASGDNKLINRSIEKLNYVKMEQAESIVKMRACFCTWANAGDKDEIARRASDLARAVENWGTCDVAETTGDPVSGLASSALGFTYSSIGTAASAPLKDALLMMPLARPSSPWKHGAVTFRSPDGKIIPYEPGSSLQSTWVNLIFAKPGSGKSVLMNMTNLALCLGSGIKRLPRIAIVDIGPSSSGLISLLQEALPNGQKHLAAYYRIRMTREYSINPFDTQLGCRFPGAAEVQFLRNFLTLITTDVSRQEPFLAMSGLVTAVLDEMYRKTQDRELPHLYAPGQEHLVDDLIEKLNFNLDKKTTWWEIVDNLFEHGYIHEATLAQRHAVPLLADAPHCAQDEKIKNTYGQVIIKETGENLIVAFNRMVNDALNMYPILARPTSFDIGDARVVSLDLDEVAKSGGPIANRQTAVMYMLARFVLAKDFHLTEEVLPEMPYPAHLECPPTVPAKQYKDYHRTRIEHIREDLKRICYDEFHRTSKAQAVRDQVLVDMREGRKWKLDVTLASQALEDFDSTMMEFTTSVFVMDGGNAQAAEKVANVFGFDDEYAKVALQTRVHGPRKGGGTFMAKFQTKAGGWYTMLLTSTLGPIELWALNTTAEDVAIRKKLYQKIGPKEARLILAQKYPQGSAAADVENRKEKLRSSGAIVDADAGNIIDQVVQELVDFKIMQESVRRR